MKGGVHFHCVWFWLCFPYAATQWLGTLCHQEILDSDSRKIAVPNMQRSVLGVYVHGGSH